MIYSWGSQKTPKPILQSSIYKYPSLILRCLRLSQVVSGSIDAASEVNINIIKLDSLPAANHIIKLTN